VTAAAAGTLTNEVQIIAEDPSWLATTPARFYRLRHLAP
jgi:hypothetical protein